MYTQNMPKRCDFWMYCVNFGVQILKGVNGWQGSERVHTHVTTHTVHVIYIAGFREGFTHRTLYMFTLQGSENGSHTTHCTCLHCRVQRRVHTHVSTYTVHVVSIAGFREGFTHHTLHVYIAGFREGFTHITTHTVHVVSIAGFREGFTHRTLYMFTLQGSEKGSHTVHCTCLHCRVQRMVHTPYTVHVYIAGFRKGSHTLPHILYMLFPLQGSHTIHCTCLHYRVQRRVHTPYTVHVYIGGFREGFTHHTLYMFTL